MKDIYQRVEELEKAMGALAIHNREEADKGPEVVECTGNYNFIAGRTGGDAFPFVLDGNGILYYPERPVEDLARFIAASASEDKKWENFLSKYRAGDSAIPIAQDILNFIANHNRAVRRKP